MGFARTTNQEECSTTGASNVVEEKSLSFHSLPHDVEHSIKELLQKEEDTEVLPQHISKAAAKGQQDIVLEWLGPPPVPASRVNAMWKGHTLLHEAVAGNRTQLVSTLLELGADVDPRSSSGFTPLEEALLYNCSDRTARLLLTWGATMDPARVIASENSDLFELIRTPLGGRRCIITGLQKNKTFNGLIGVATHYVASQEIYVIQVDGHEKAFTIASSNLVRQDHVPKYGPLLKPVATTKKVKQQQQQQQQQQQLSPRVREEFPRIKPRISTAPIEEWDIFPSDFDWGLEEEDQEITASDVGASKLPVEPTLALSRMLRVGCEDYSTLTPVVSRI